jgi:hypothetical protein
MGAAGGVCGVNARYYGWSLVDHPPCGCKGVRFVAGERLGRWYYLTCLHCKATWQARAVYGHTSPTNLSTEISRAPTAKT